MLTCCCQHKCRLQEICGHCDELISLFTALHKLDRCPKCQKSLKLYTAPSILDEAELEAATHIQDDIVFLLTPQPWEADSSRIIKCVGQRLAHIRRMKRLTAMEVASQVGVTLTVVEGMERGDFQGRGATLQSYIKYAHYLCLGLKGVFSDVIDGSGHAAPTPLPLCPACQQSCYVTRNGYNRSGSQRYQCQHCHCNFTASPESREVERLSS